MMENFDLRLLKWFQKSLILKASKVETSSLTLFLRVRNLPFSGFEWG